MNSIDIKHPCFNYKYIKDIGRIHLPVALECNMQCNYCSRDYDCANENRPGVCSKIIGPDDVYEYTKSILKKHPEIEVIGIAGPGEVLANIKIFQQTLTIIKKHFPDKQICIATNGLTFTDNIDLILKHNIKFITITINSTNINNLNQIYDWVKYRNLVIKSNKASEIIMKNQLKALKILKQNNIIFKINTIVIPGINENEIIEIAYLAKKYNAFAINIVPMINAKGSKFEKKPIIEHNKIIEIRKKCSKIIKVIDHCRLCRSDAAGLIL